MSMFGGASERLAFLLDLDAGGAIQGFRQVGQEADRSLGKTDDRLNRLGGRMQVAGAGAVAFAGVAGRALYSLAEASEEAHRSELALQNTYANAPQLAGESADAIMELAGAIQDKTAADADDIIAGAAVLGQYGAEQQEIIGLTGLVVDLARKKGVDLVAANAAVGKALEGNRGALARMGIVVDETAFATDRYTAIQEAMSKAVGGFAEAEGRTFAGQVERMKNEVGDLAEGVGVGVVEAFGGMVSAGSGAIDTLSGLGAGTQAGIGKFLAYGTAATGAIGALSFLSGTLVKLSDRFTTVNAEAGNTRSLNAFGKAAAGLGIATTVAGLYEMGEALKEAHADVEALSTATDGELNDALDRWGTLLESDNRASQQLADQMVDANIPAAERLADAMDAAGLSSDFLRSKIEEQREADVQGAIDQENYSEEVREGAEATEESAAAHQTAAEAVREHEEGIRGITDAMQDYIDEALTSLDLTADWEAALDGLTESVREHGATLNLDTEAGRENYQQGREVADGLVALMQQRFEETQSIQAAIDAGNLYVEQLKIQLRQAGLTEDEVNNYVNTLRLVPRDIATNFRANTAEAVRQIQELQRLAAGVGANSYEVDFHSRRPGARASGGPVSANTPYIVGEQGPELFVPGSSGSVVPNHALGGGQTVIVLQVDRHVLGSVVVDSLGAYESTNGPIPVRVRG